MCKCVGWDPSERQCGGKKGRKEKCEGKFLSVGLVVSVASAFYTERWRSSDFPALHNGSW